MTRAIEQIQAAAAVDERFCIGLVCTWSGPIGETTMKPSRYLTNCPTWVCPKCGGELAFVPSEEDFWATIRQGERRSPGYEKMMRWGFGKCFPGVETLVNAYRQAMEE